MRRRTGARFPRTGAPNTASTACPSHSFSTPTAFRLCLRHLLPFSFRVRCGFTLVDLRLGLRARRAPGSGFVQSGAGRRAWRCRCDGYSRRGFIGLLPCFPQRQHGEHRFVLGGLHARRVDEGITWQHLRPWGRTILRTVDVTIELFDDNVGG